MKLILTRKKTIELCIEVWQWCMETGRRKEQWPRWKEFGDIASHCWFCEYDNRRRKRENEDGLSSCGRCPLQSIDIAHCSLTVYKKWNNAITIKDRKKYAKLFLEQIKTIV